ncbi:VOC family protein [Methylobacterium oryzisoli]|uniref:VOC family protein n=1 Tax=Methylobacterium oryzisoli TaxID=3385502 RepID=UPI0038927B31
MSARLAAVRMIAREPERLADFYVDAFGFARVPTRDDPARLAALFGVARVESVTLRLGTQELMLVGTTPHGRPYPDGTDAADTLFQHIALVVPDMAAAMRRLEAVGGFRPISDGPQVLPPNTGGVTAYKFRDPEGHPLELLQFPPGGAPPAWTEMPPGATCLGYDHSAIVVMDTAASIAFYERLGFVQRGGSLNTGREQERLDAVPGARVEVTALGSRPRPPHLELLAYGPGTRCTGCADVDVAATQLVLALPDAAAFRAVLTDLGAAPVDPGSGALVRDPDGHRLVLHSPESAP